MQKRPYGLKIDRPLGFHKPEFPFFVDLVMEVKQLVKDLDMFKEEDEE